ncbi:pectate lyase [Eleftheria terrae]|uniref:pectate lyase n=1 Tax=Eleftheria terrae TaxID=1597781 RepID=UPI00263AE58A|nr:pectate lyase [Eleftheria terrae]WKB55599.1 pectate lyase [Eleftheria terrae]
MSAVLSACGGGGGGTEEGLGASSQGVDAGYVETAAAMAVAAGGNLAVSADGSSKAGGSSYARVVDGDTDTYWQPASANAQRISAKGFSSTVGSAKVHELTNSVVRWRLVNHDSGKLLASGTTLGADKLIRFTPVKSSKLDLFIDQAHAAPQIAEFEVYAHNGLPPGDGGELPPDDGGPPPPGNAGPATGASCQSTGSVPLEKTYVVKAGQVFDGQCRTYNPTFGDGSQDEHQAPAFLVEKGGVLKNVIIGNNGVDGVHVYGDATIDNVTWSNVGEDALTVKAAGKVTVRNITGYDAADKFFQLNAATTFTLENVVVVGTSKLFRENGGKCYPVQVTVQRARLSEVKEAVFRSDCARSRFALSQAELNNVKTVCYAKGKYRSCGLH